VPEVTCEIIRCVDDSYPGWVEARLIDADGTRWTFTDKAPIFCAEALTSAASYPIAGVIRCTIVDVDKPRNRTLIDTSLPDGVTATDGVTTQFSVHSRLVVT
jgi:hypothetical protein